MPGEEERIGLRFEVSEQGADQTKQKVAGVEEQLHQVAQASDALTEAIAGGNSKEQQTAFGKVESSVKDLRKEVRGLRTDNKALQRHNKRLLDDLKKVERGAKGAANEIKKKGKASKNAGLAVLEGSRALEDLQFGIRGVLNNLPQLVQHMGGGAGLAGVVSIVAVSLTVLLPLFFDLGAEMEKAKRKSDEMAASLLQLEERMRSQADTARDRSFAESLEKERALIELQNKELRTSLNLVEARADAQRRITAAQNDALRTEISASDLPDAEKAIALANLESAAARAEGRSGVDAVDRQLAAAKQKDNEILLDIMAARGAQARAEGDARPLRRRLDNLEGDENVIRQIFSDRDALDDELNGSLMRRFLSEFRVDAPVELKGLKRRASDTGFRSLDDFEQTLRGTRSSATKAEAKVRRQAALVRAAERQRAIHQQTIQELQERRTIEEDAFEQLDALGGFQRGHGLRGDLEQAFTTEAGGLVDQLGGRAEGVRQLLGDNVPNRRQIGALQGELQALLAENGESNLATIQTLISLRELVTQFARQMEDQQREIEALRANGGL